MQRNDINSDDLRRRNMVDAWRLDAPVDAKDPLSITRSSGVMVRPLTFGSLPDLRSAERNEAQDDHEIRTQPVRHLVHLSVRLCPSLLRPWKRTERQNSRNQMLHIQSEISLSDTSHVNANYAADESDRRHQDAFVLAFGMRGSHIGGFEDAKHVTCLTNGRLLISDYINSRLQVCTTKGGCLAVLDKDVKFPWAAVLTPDNNIAVTLCTERCVRIYSMDGDLLQMFGENLFVCPTGIACDDKGRMIVCDAKTDKVSVFDKYGNFVRFLGNFDRVEETFSKPGYVCISVNGDIIISDSGNHKIKVFDAECNFVKAFGSFGRGDGQFKCPYDVATNVFGNIFVADHYNSRISVFTRDGVFIRHMLCSKHGLLHPQGVTVTTDNHLVVTHGHLKATEILVFRLAIESTKPYRCDIIEYV